MTATTEITRVTVRWDEQEGCEPGWYCQSWAGKEYRDDSQKIWWPIDTDEYAETDAEDLADALQDAFPNAEIKFLN